MTSRHADPKTFFDAPDAVAIRVEPDELFGLLTRSLQLPQDQAALVTRRQGDRVVCRPGSTLSGDDATDILLVRTSPLAVSCDGLTATSVDHYQCSVTATLRVTLIPDAGELASFRKSVMGNSRTVRDADVRQYFEPHLVKAVALAAEGRGVEVLIEAKTSDAIAAEIAHQLKGPAFSAGLKIDRPIDVGFDSHVYRQVRRSRADAQRRCEEFTARRRIERAAEMAQEQHAEHLSELVNKLRQQADQNPRLELADLLRTFSEVDRGELYGAIFASCYGQTNTQSIVVGSGGELLWFDPKSLDTPVRRMLIPDSAGSVRSVQVYVDASGRRRLLIGASTGVHEVSADGDENPQTYRVQAGDNVRGGVNSVALSGDRILASHSELGLLSWLRGSDGPATLILSDRTRHARTVRAVQFFNGDIFFSIDDTVSRVRADELEAAPIDFRGSGSSITAVCATTDGVFAGNADGEILYWSYETPDQPTLLNAARRRSAESVTLLDLGGVKRLFYTDTSLAVSARVIGDTFTCRYEAGGQTLLRAEAAADVIVATNELRDRIICWTPGDPAKPYAVAQVARLTGHSIQDVCLVPSA